MATKKQQQPRPPAARERFVTERELAEMLGPPLGEMLESLRSTRAMLETIEERARPATSNRPALTLVKEPPASDEQG